MDLIDHAKYTTHRFCDSIVLIARGGFVTIGISIECHRMERARPVLSDYYYFDAQISESIGRDYLGVLVGKQRAHGALQCVVQNAAFI